MQTHLVPKIMHPNIAVILWQFNYGKMSSSLSRFNEKGILSHPERERRLLYIFEHDFAQNIMINLNIIKQIYFCLIFCILDIEDSNNNNTKA